MQLEQCLVLLCKKKMDWQSECSISGMRSAILWAVAFFRGERRGMSTVKVRTYPQSCGLLCWEIICKPPGVLDLQSRLGQTKYPTFAQLPLNHLTQKSTNREENIRIWWVHMCTICQKMRIFREGCKHLDIMSSSLDQRSVTQPLSSTLQYTICIAWG